MPLSVVPSSSLVDIMVAAFPSYLPIARSSAPPEALLPGAPPGALSAAALAAIVAFTVDASIRAPKLPLYPSAPLPVVASPSVPAAAVAAAQNILTARGVGHGDAPTMLAQLPAAADAGAPLAPLRPPDAPSTPRAIVGGIIAAALSVAGAPGGLVGAISSPQCGTSVDLYDDASTWLASPPSPPSSSSSPSPSSASSRSSASASRDAHAAASPSLPPYVTAVMDADVPSSPPSPSPSSEPLTLSYAEGSASALYTAVAIVWGGALVAVALWAMVSFTMTTMGAAADPKAPPAAPSHSLMSAWPPIAPQRWEFPTPLGCLAFASRYLLLCGPLATAAAVGVLSRPNMSDDHPASVVVAVLALAANGLVLFAVASLASVAAMASRWTPRQPRPRPSFGSYEGVHTPRLVTRRDTRAPHTAAAVLDDDALAQPDSMGNLSEVPWAYAAFSIHYRVYTRYMFAYGILDALACHAIAALLSQSQTSCCPVLWASFAVAVVRTISLVVLRPHSALHYSLAAYAPAASTAALAIGALFFYLCPPWEHGDRADTRTLATILAALGALWCVLARILGALWNQLGSWPDRDHLIRIIASRSKLAANEMALGDPSDGFVLDTWVEIPSKALPTDLASLSETPSSSKPAVTLSRSNRQL